MRALNNLTRQLHPGTVYRRSELAKWTTSVDRHLRQLQEQGKLCKLSGGLYYYPKSTAFGEAPADDEKLVTSFLKDKRFLLTTPNAYNTLGVGTTQLYNETIVYNHKRHGRFKLGGRVFDFRMKHHFPAKLSSEFLLVDLVDHLQGVAEDREKVLYNVKQKMASMNQKNVLKIVQAYGGSRAKKFFSEALGKDI